MRVNQNYFKTDEHIFRGDPGFHLCASVMEPQDVTVPHSHEFTECIFITRGMGKHQCGKHPEQNIQRGDILIIPPGGIHSYTEVSDDLFLVNFLFDTAHLPPVLLELYTHPGYQELFLRDIAYYSDCDFPMFHPADEVFEELELFANQLVRFSKTPGNHCRKLGIFMVLLSLVADARKTGNCLESQTVLDIPKLTAFLQNNFQRQIYLEELSQLAAMSDATLMRHFRAALGMTPMVYLRTLRLKHSAELLLNSRISIKEVVLSSGFLTESYFFRAFKAYYGMTPEEFRNRGSHPQKNDGRI